ncbi:hypothetical protein ACFL3D_04160 [Candidatus Omnitrophota bacterium]
MQIFANKQLIPFEIKHEKTIGEIIDSLLLLTNQVNKVIIDIKVDGASVSLAERDTFQNTSLEGIEKIDLLIENKLQLVLYALQEAESHLPKFSVNLSEISELLMAGQKHKAMALFGDALVTWRKVINYLKTVALSYQLDFNKIMFGEKTIEEKNYELLHVLQEIKKAMEKEDIVSLGDLIEYELIEKVNEQGKIIEELKKIAKDKDTEILDAIKAKIEGSTVGV